MDLAAKSVTFGTLALTELRASHVETWVKSMQDKGLEPTTVRTRFANVRNVLRAAVRDRCMPSDVADRVRLPRQRKASAAMTIPTAEEVGAVIWAADGEYAMFIAVCAFAGLRRPERRPRCRSETSTFSARRSTCHGRCSGPMTAGWRSARPSTARSAPYSSRTAWRPCWPSTSGATGRATIPTAGCSPAAGDATLPAHAATVARSVADRPRQGGHRAPAARSAALLRLRVDCGGLRRGDGAAGARALSASVTLDTYSHLWPDANDRTRKAAAGLLDEALGAAADALRTER